MHPMSTHQIALQNQRRMLDQAAADRLARQATAGRPSLIARLSRAVRPAGRAAASRPEPRPESRPATTGQA